MDLSAHGLLVTYHHHHHSSLLVLVPPRFIDELESQAVIPKSDVFFKSVFEGTSPFMVKWFKDDTELITGPSCRVSLEKYSSSVELCSVGTLQSGIYSCQVSNEAGTAKSAAQLLVKGWTILFLSTIITVHLTPSFFSIFTALPYLHLSFLRFIAFQKYLCYFQSPLSQQPVMCLHPPSLPLLLKCYFMLRIVTWYFSYFAEPPQFVLKLPPSTFVKQYEGHCFECKVTSVQSLRICWYKNDQQITDGGNYNTVCVDSNAYLQISNATFDDNGVYTCEAHNDAGSASCSSVLTVQGQLLNRDLAYGFCLL